MKIGEKKQTELTLSGNFADITCEKKLVQLNLTETLKSFSQIKKLHSFFFFSGAHHFDSVQTGIINGGRKCQTFKSNLESLFLFRTVKMLYIEKKYRRT